MLPMMPGTNPTAFGTLAVVVTIGLGGAVLTVGALFGWATLELICLMDRYAEV